MVRDGEGMGEARVFMRVFRGFLEWCPEGHSENGGVARRGVAFVGERWRGLAGGGGEPRLVS